MCVVVIVVDFESKILSLLGNLEPARQASYYCTKSPALDVSGKKMSLSTSRLMNRRDGNTRLL